MTNKEREYAELGVEHAEGIEECESGTVYLGGKLFYFEKTIGYDEDDNEVEEWEGWFDNNDGEVTVAPTLKKLFEEA